MADVEDLQRRHVQVIDALTVRVAALQQTVDTLVDVLERSGTISASDRRLVARAGRRAREDFALDDDDTAVEHQGAVVGSPYRGATPIDGSGCAVCGKLLAPDDPELTLAARGKVCTMCFTRGG